MKSVLKTLLKIERCAKVCLVHFLSYIFVFLVLFYFSVVA